MKSLFVLITLLLPVQQEMEMPADLNPQNDALPAVRIGGGYVPHLLEADGRRAYNKILQELTKGYKGETSFQGLEPERLIGDLESGRLDCAIVSETRRDSWRETGQMSHLEDMGTVGRLEVALYASLDAPPPADLAAIVAAGLTVQPAAMRHIALPQSTQTSRDIRAVLQRLLNRELDYFIALRTSVDPLLDSYDIWHKVNVITFDLPPRVDHFICRDGAQLAPYRAFAREKLADLKRSGWLDDVHMMN